MNLSPSKVREIAATWYSGGTSALYALASSGAILPYTINEIDDCIAICDNPAWERELRQLRAYVLDRDVRGPMDGWANVRF